MTEPANALNPYQSPLHDDLPTAAFEAGPLRPTTYTGALLRWTPVCLVSAGPSFFFGLMVSDHPWEIPVMVLGVALFILAYAAIDVGQPWRRLMSNLRWRRFVLTAYGCRIAASVIFPIAAFNDVLCGMLSIGFTGLLWGGLAGGGLEGSGMQGVGQIFLTTIVQGLLLNAEVFVLVLLLIGVGWLFRAVVDAIDGVRRRPPSPTAATAATAADFAAAAVDVHQTTPGGEKSPR